MNDLEIMKFYCNKCKQKGTCIEPCPDVIKIQREDRMMPDIARENIFEDLKPLRTGLFEFITVSDKEDKMHNFGQVIDIEKNTLGDTRSAEKKPTMSEFDMANRAHREDVTKVMNSISDLIHVVGMRHDDTKITNRDEFYSDFCYTLDHPKEKFEKSDWYQMHINTERHHIVARTPDDVDLIDVLEHIVDCCCAGKARNNGVIKPIIIPDDILQKAVENTVRMIDNNTRLVSHK